MSAKAWRARRKDKRVRSALRKVWRYHASVRRLAPIKSEWINGTWQS